MPEEIDRRKLKTALTHCIQGKEPQKEYAEIIFEAAVRYSEEALIKPPITPEEARKVLEFCLMVEEIGMLDNTVIPVWPNDTEMCLTHPLTVGMVKTIRKVLEACAGESNA